MIDMLKALHYCHNVIKLIHKDIKPDNIVINKQHQAVLIDFGVSALFNDDNNTSQSCMGSYLYQAPEIFKDQDLSDNHAKKGQKSDIWSLGITIYELLCGINPYQDAVNVLQLKEIMNKR